MTARADTRANDATPFGFWRSLFRGAAFKDGVVEPPLTDPLHCDTPVLRGAEIAAVYTGQRVAGDFYEFLRAGRERMLFVLLDLAGQRADTRELLIAVQRTFRTQTPELFGREDFNETTAMIELCYAMNRTILRGGVRSCPAFLGCYNETLGTVCYANAGHTPALLRDPTGITRLDATGLPLGLFSHTKQSAGACHLVPGASLLMVSRGIVEADCDGVEFGLERTIQTLGDAPGLGARALCQVMLQAARRFASGTSRENDLTALAVVRSEITSSI